VKLLRYGLPGQEKPGVLDGQGRVRDLSGVIPDVAGAALLPESLARLRGVNIDSQPLVAGIPQKDLRLGACVGNVGKFICIGLNYSDHAAESGMQVPPEPVVFNKWTSAIVGPDDAVEIPRGSSKPTGKWSSVWSSAKAVATSTRRMRCPMWPAIVW